MSVHADRVIGPHPVALTCRDLELVAAQWTVQVSPGSAAPGPHSLPLSKPELTLPYRASQCPLPWAVRLRNRQREGPQ